jgi:hypothetical protein
MRNIFELGTISYEQNKNIVAGDIVQLNLGTGSAGANKTLRALTVHLTYSVD